LGTRGNTRAPQPDLEGPMEYPSAVRFLVMVDAQARVARQAVVQSSPCVVQLSRVARAILDRAFVFGVAQQDEAERIEDAEDDRTDI
jgi:hypothetical protein